MLVRVFSTLLKEKIKAMLNCDRLKRRSEREKKIHRRWGSVGEFVVSRSEMWTTSAGKKKKRQRNASDLTQQNCVYFFSLRLSRSHVHSLDFSSLWEHRANMKNWFVFSLSLARASIMLSCIHIYVYWKNDEMKSFGKGQEIPLRRVSCCFFQSVALSVLHVDLSQASCLRVWTIASGATLLSYANLRSFSWSKKAYAGRQSWIHARQQHIGFFFEKITRAHTKNV